MKKLIILSAIAITSLVISTSAQAQVRFNVNINIGAQPAWVATPDPADYYYIPDIDCYYSAKERVYVYRDGNNWRRGASLPSRYRGYDFRNKRVIAIRGQERPYLHDNRNAFAQANNRYDHHDQDRHDRNDRRNDHDNRRDGRRSK